MSNPSSSPRKRNTRALMKSLQEDNNNTSNKFSNHQQARTFIQWFKHMIDNERQNLSLYCSDDAMLEWFGRTIKTRKKVTTFLKYDMQCTRHYFTTVESIERIQTRQEKSPRHSDTILATPLYSPEIVKPGRPLKRRLRSNCNSPEWAEGCNPDEKESYKGTERKRMNINTDECVDVKNVEASHQNISKRAFIDDTPEITNKGDGLLGRRVKRKCVLATPPNHEVGQGDCLPSTSETDANRSHDALNAQLPKLAVECNGYVEFARSRNNRSADTMKWERKCKLQISYSEDPLNVGEYIIWVLRYTDESKCRRNLLSAFEEAAREDVKNA